MRQRHDMIVNIFHDYRKWKTLLDNIYWFRSYKDNLFFINLHQSITIMNQNRSPVVIFLNLN